MGKYMWYVCVYDVRTEIISILSIVVSLWTEHTCLSPILHFYTYTIVATYLTCFQYLKFISFFFILLHVLLILIVQPYNSCHSQRIHLDIPFPLFSLLVIAFIPRSGGIFEKRIILPRWHK
jgi:hypothetical protein